MATADDTQQVKPWFGHPPQLARLFGTEMWERLGYYGMRAILLLYLTKHVLFDQEQGIAIYTAFVSLVYLTPLVGGAIADRYLGSRNAVKLGALIMAVGYFGLVFGGPQAREYLVFNGARHAVVSVDGEGQAARQYLAVGDRSVPLTGTADGSMRLAGGAALGLPDVLRPGAYTRAVERDPFHLALMFAALAFVIIGNGLFKPNISTMVGSLYGPDDPRRLAGFTLFYLGINMGALFGQMFVPMVRRSLGFNYAFLLPAIGMLIAYVIMQRSERRLAGFGEAPDAQRLAAPAFAGLTLRGVIVVAALAATVPAWLLVQREPLVGTLLTLASIAGFLGVIAHAVATLDPTARDKTIVAVVLTFFSILFWALFEQAGTSFTLFADCNTDRRVAGWSMPPDMVQFFNALFIILLAPMFSLLWKRLAETGHEPSTPAKFAIGLICAGAGFFVLVASVGHADAGSLVPLHWLALTYLVHTIGELCLSPVGLNMITSLSTARMVGTMMGLWFLSSSLAQYVGGRLAMLTATPALGGSCVDPAAQLAQYDRVFTLVGATGVGIGLVLLLLSPVLRRMMHGVN